MLDPYRMVFTNLFSILILIFGLIIFKFKFPKKRINLFFLLLLISLVPIISIFRLGSYESGDFNIHVLRAMEFDLAFHEGILMPSWAPNLNATYGLPLFIFNYTLPYYLISAFHYLGFSFVTSLKLLLATSFIFSGIFMYLFSNRLFKNSLAAFTASIFYLFAPYHLIDLHFKVVIGEVLAFTFIPLFFYHLLKLEDSEKRTVTAILGGISLALLVSSHVFIAFGALGLAILYVLFKSWRNINLSYLTMATLILICGLLISSYIWAAPLFMSQYTVVAREAVKFIPLENPASLFYSPWRFGLLFQGHRGEIATLIGYTHVFVFLYILYKFVFHKIKKSQSKDILFWIAINIFVFIMLLPFSKPLWELLPYIKSVGQHRLLILLSFTLSILAGYLALTNLKQKVFIVLLIFITIFSTILNWGHRRTIPQILDNQLKKELPLSTYNFDQHFYANPRWTDPKNPWFNNIPQNKIEILNGIGKIEKISRSSTQHVYKVNAKSDLEVLENILYFPGWSAKTGNKTVQIRPNNKGIIVMKIPAGNYKLEIIYKDIFILDFLKNLSIATLLVSFLIMVIAGKKSSKKRLL